VLDGLEVVYVERLESHHMLPIFRKVGHRLPAHWTSSGKVLLAALPRAELERRLEGWAPAAHTPRTITSRARLLAELDRVAAQGWAHNMEEGHTGVVSIGAPVRGPDGVVMAGLSVVASSERMTPTAMRRLAPQIIGAADLIARRLGYRPVRA
jgi:DNA-binding IclR family transcriptional regulator